MRLMKAAVATILMTTGATFGAAAQTVSDGNFTGTTGFIQQGTTNNQSLPGWTITTGGSGSYTGVATGPTITAGTTYFGSGGDSFTTSPGTVPGGYTGNIFINDAGSPYSLTISQTITNLISAHAYALSFYYAGAQQTGFSGASTDFWAVSLNGSPATDTPNITIGFGTPGGNQGIGPTDPWAKETINFITTGTSETLSFLAAGTGTGQPPFMMLANVTIFNVPEPASFAMLGLGVAGLLGLRRYQRSPRVAI
jgi:PEP-CTERM motif